MFEYAVDINHKLHHYTSGIHREQKWKILLMCITTIAVFFVCCFFLGGDGGGEFFVFFFYQFKFAMNDLLQNIPTDFNIIHYDIYKNPPNKKIGSFFFLLKRNNLILTDFSFLRGGNAERRSTSQNTHVIHFGKL